MALLGALRRAIEFESSDITPGDFSQILIYVSNLKRLKRPWPEQAQAYLQEATDRINQILSIDLLKRCLEDIDLSVLHSDLKSILYLHNNALSASERSHLSIYCERWVENRDSLDLLCNEIEGLSIFPEVRSSYISINNLLQTYDDLARENQQAFLSALPYIDNLRSFYEPDFLHGWWWTLTKQQYKPSRKWLKNVYKYFTLTPIPLAAASGKEFLALPLEHIYKICDIGDLEFAIFPYKGQFWFAATGSPLESFLLKSIWLNGEKAEGGQSHKVQTRDSIFFPIGRLEEKTEITFWVEIENEDHTFRFTI